MCYSIFRKSKEQAVKVLNQPEFLMQEEGAFCCYEERKPIMQSATMEFDTIAAISTPPGEGAISIVRLSGEQAVAIANKVYRSGTKDLAKVPTHTIHYGHIVDPQNDQLIDEVMLSVMRAPKHLHEKTW